MNIVTSVVGQNMIPKVHSCIPLYYCIVVIISITEY